MAATFPGGPDGKESACSAGDLGSTSGWSRSPGEGNSNPLQCSCLGNLMDGGAWWAVGRGVERLTLLGDSRLWSGFLVSACGILGAFNPQPGTHEVKRRPGTPPPHQSSGPAVLASRPSSLHCSLPLYVCFWFVFLIFAHLAVPGLSAVFVVIVIQLTLL